MFGLTAKDRKIIVDITKQFEEINEIILFGSRAMGNFKRGSDVDLALKGERVTKSIVHQVDDYLNEQSLMPYFFDVLDYKEIKNTALKNHIDTEGKTLYKK